MTKGKRKNYFTVQELMTQAIEMAKQDELAPELADAIIMLDYQQVYFGAGERLLKRLEFDVIGSVEYGASEGIYGHLYVRGYWLPEHEQSAWGQEMQIYVLKTLRDDKLAYFAMGTMVTMLCYYANKIIAENMSRFD